MPVNLSKAIESVVPSLEGQIFAVVARTTEPMTGSQIARLITGRSNAGVRLALARLVDDGTVAVSKAGSSLLYLANRDHVMWPAIEALVRAASKAMASIEDRIVELLNESLSVYPAAASSTTVAVFGSVARGGSTAASDLDLVILFPASVPTETGERIVDRLTASVPRWTGNRCNIYSLVPDRLDELVSAHDPMIESWINDAQTFNGPDLARGLRLRIQEERSENHATNRGDDGVEREAARGSGS